MESITMQKAADLTGLTLRQVSYWKRTNIIAPTHVSKRRVGYVLSDVISLYLISSFLKAGITIHKARTLKDTFIKVITDNQLTVDEFLVTYVDKQLALYLVRGIFFTTKPADHFKCVISFKELLKNWLKFVYEECTPIEEGGPCEG